MHDLNTNIQLYIYYILGLKQIFEYSISNDSTRVLNFCSATHGHGFC